MSKKNGLLAIWMFFLVSIFLFYGMGLQVSPSVLAIDLMNDLNIDSKSLGLLSGFYFYSYTLMQIPSGLLYDRLNAKLIVFCASFITSLGALFFGLSEEFFYAAIGRVMLGLGSSFAFVGVLVIAYRWFSTSWFALMAGSAQFIAGFGALAGAFPLAFFVSKYSWRDSMIALGIFGILLAIVCLIFIKDRPVKEKKEKRHDELSIRQSLKLLVLEPQNIYGAIFSFFTWGPVLVFAGLWGVPFFVTKYGISNTDAALLISWIWIGVAVTSPLHGLISDYLRRRKIVLTVSAIVGVISSLVIIYGPIIPNTFIGILLFLFGLASASQILAFALIRENNQAEIVGTGMGFNNMAVVMGGAILQPLVGILMDQSHLKNQTGYSLFSYEFSLAVVPICFFIAAIVSIFFIKETHARHKG